MCGSVNAQNDTFYKHTITGPTKVPREDGEEEEEGTIKGGETSFYVQNRIFFFFTALNHAIAYGVNGGTFVCVLVCIACLLLNRAKNPENGK